MLVKEKMLTIMNAKLREITFTKIHRLISYFFLMFPRFSVYFNNVTIFICIILDTKIAKMLCKKKQSR